ncbi:SdpI family protein [Leifsonia sp. McL0607]|uniref:SdpI family protein n=1 Tax=Leifsonia sp. McL0607 TaxID=3415672 RepID=UPI003CF04A06
MRTLPELGLTVLVAAIPVVTYLLTVLAIKVGPNPLVGFRISRKMKDEALWKAVHQSLLPHMSKQILLSITALPVIAALYLLPPSFPFLLIAMVVLMLAAVSVTIRHAYREIEMPG